MTLLAVRLPLSFHVVAYVLRMTSLAQRVVVCLAEQHSISVTVVDPAGIRPVRCVTCHTLDLAVFDKQRR